MQNMERAEELLFEGMIDLSSSGIIQSIQGNSEPIPTDKSTEGLEYLDITNPIQFSNTTNDASETFASSERSTQKEDNIEHEHRQDEENVISNIAVTKKPEQYVPSLMVPYLTISNSRESMLHNVNSFYLKVSEDECFEGYYPSSTKHTDILTSLDDRINQEYKQIVDRFSNNSSLGSKYPKQLKQNFNKKETKNKRRHKLSSLSDDKAEKEKVVQSSSSDREHISGTNAGPSNVQGDDDSKKKDNNAYSNKGNEGTPSFAPSKIPVPKVPKSGDEWYDLPGGWKKRAMQRKSGSSAGGWDVYLHPPPPGKRLRSSTELMRFVKDHPEMDIDPLYVNMDLPFRVSADGKPSIATQKLITAIKEIKESGSISEKLFGATAAEKISTPEPMAQHLCKTPKQENIYAKTYHSQAYLKDSSADLPNEIPSESREDANNPYQRPYLSQTYLRRNRYAPVKFARPHVFKRPQMIPKHRYRVSSKLFSTRRPTMSQLFILERLFSRSICMPSPQKVTQWSAKLELNRIEVMQWFRCKWRAKLQYEAELDALRQGGIDDYDTEHNTFESLNVSRQLQKFELEKAYDIVLDPTTEIDLITEGDFVIDFENDDEEQATESDHDIPIAGDQADTDSIEIEYHDIKVTEE